MLRRLRVRTRLFTLIAVPLALLLVLAVPETLQRRQQATAADGAARLTEEATHVAAALDALETERVLSAARRAGSDETEAALAAQRALTDTAVERAEAALTAMAVVSDDLAAVAGSALDTLESLPGVRDETDTSDSIVPWSDPFAPVVGTLLQVQEDLGAVVADAGLGAEQSQAALVARTKEAASEQTAQLAAAAVWGELRGDQVRILSGLRADELAYRTAYLVASESDSRVERRAEIQRGAATDAGRVVDAVTEDEELDALGSLERWLSQGAERQDTLTSVEAARAGEAEAHARAMGDSARRSSTAYALLAAAGIALAVAIALLTARSITRPLRRLTEAADHLAEERLPQLVEALRHPGEDDERYLAATVEPLEAGSDDELGRLGRAFNSVQSVAVTVAAEQADFLRKGISDLYVNLARRNQTLIERQIELLDRLEAEEQDPEVLDHLYMLDHLGTRMRRNAESLLVLAGADSGPRRSRPIGVVDVVRAALGEVEDYERVDFGVMAPATVAGPAVSDVAHIVAELLENASHFSPPNTRVRVEGSRTSGSYQLMITDQGIGMPAEQMATLNAVLEAPPVTGLALGRSLGCLVAARLAFRHGITVRLRPGAQRGTTAYVVLPRHLLADDDLAAPTTPDPAEETIAAPMGRRSPSPAAAPAAAVARTSRRADRADRPDRPAHLADALPAITSFDAGIHAVLGHPAGAGDAPVDRVVPPPAPPLPRRDEAPVDAAAPRATLARRVPGASRPDTGAPVVGERVRRSPEEVRSMLSRYRSGLRAGRESEPTAPMGEERS